MTRSIFPTRSIFSLAPTKRPAAGILQRRQYPGFTPGILFQEQEPVVRCCPPLLPAALDGLWVGGSWVTMCRTLENAEPTAQRGSDTHTFRISENTDLTTGVDRSLQPHGQHSCVRSGTPTPWQTQMKEIVAPHSCQSSPPIFSSGGPEP